MATGKARIVGKAGPKKIKTTAERKAEAKPKPTPAKKKTTTRRKPTIRPVSEAERLERMKILTTKERKKVPTKAERAKRAIEVKAAIKKREFEKKIEAQRKKAAKFEKPFLRVAKPTVAKIVRAKTAYERAEERVSAKIPTLGRISQAGAKFAKAHPKTAKRILTGFEKAHVKTQVVGTETQRQALAGYTYGSYQSLQQKPVKTSAMFGAGLVGGRAISVIGKVGKAFGAGAKAAKMAKATELGIVAVYGVQTTKHIMDAPTPYEAGQRAAEAMYTEILPMGIGARIAAKPLAKLPKVKKVKPIPKPIKKAKVSVRYKVAKVARPVARPIKVKKAAIARKIAEKKRIVKVQQLKTKTSARDHVQKINKTINKFGKQLDKLKKDERGEVELIRTKQKEIEKTKSLSEIQKGISKEKANIRNFERTFERTKDLAIKGRIKIAQKRLRTLERDKITRESVRDEMLKLKQKVRSSRQKIKETEKVIESEKVVLRATKERLKVLVVGVERIRPEKVKEVEVVTEKEMLRELERVREIEREIEKVSVRERVKVKELELEKVKEKERVRVKEKVKEEIMPKIPVIPKLRAVKKKKAVKVVRKVTKEYTNFQIVNQMTGINQLFG